MSQAEIQISVRALVEFLLRSGDIDRRRGGFADREAMQAGSRIHRKIQNKRGSDYNAEVPLRFEQDCGEYLLVIDGRADGIFRAPSGMSVIEEIKGIYADPNRFEEPIAVHLAQAKCYAYIYGTQRDLKKISVRITYVQMESEYERRFEMDYSLEELTTWFQGLVEEYRKWTDFQMNWIKQRNASMQNLEFPYPYRKGQREVVVDVYRTILRQKQLFVQAPTGIGKTMSAVFPAVRALGESKADKIFYLTAKTITRTVAEEAFSILRNNGLACKNVTLTAKEKICVCETCDCTPENCPRAKGHFDRVNDALYEMLTTQSGYGREEILLQAEKWQVCPHEFQLDLSNFMDAVICDYNYVFDPNARLKRYFGEGTRKGNYVFLIDEAHNLVERGRECFSAGILRSDFTGIRKKVREEAKKYKKKDDGQISLDFSALVAEVHADKPSSEVSSAWSISSGSDDNADNQNLKITDGLSDRDILFTGKADFRNLSGKNDDEYWEMEEQPEIWDEGAVSGVRRHSGRKKASAEDRKRMLAQLDSRLSQCCRTLAAYKKECSGCDELPFLGDFLNLLLSLIGITEDVLSEWDDRELREPLLEFYFKILAFSNTYELVDENYLIYDQLTEDDDLYLKLFCVNPAANLQACLDRGISTVFFSATMLPLHYYQGLLTTREENYAVYIDSPFDREQRLLRIGLDVSSKYKRRTHDEFLKMAAYIASVTMAKKGNYMVFFPSYALMEEVYDLFVTGFADAGEITCIRQTSSMTEADREAFLAEFAKERESGLVGFCVMGGIFSEGIDLTGDRLIGAMVIGTGLPQLSEERELLRRYYDRSGKNGFDYAYRYPGMNKVLQAAGRVIRTTEDKGVILLLDERFQERQSRELFPREWSDIRGTNIRTIAGEIEEFWQKQ